MPNDISRLEATILSISAQLAHDDLKSSEVKKIVGEQPNPAWQLAFKNDLVFYHDMLIKWAKNYYHIQ